MHIMMKLIPILFQRNLEDMQPERSPIQVERSKALHELVESYKKAEQGERNETDSSTPYVSNFLYCFFGTLVLMINSSTMKLPFY